MIQVLGTASKSMSCNVNRYIPSAATESLRKVYVIPRLSRAALNTTS